MQCRKKNDDVEETRHNRRGKKIEENMQKSIQMLANALFLFSQIFFLTGVGSWAILAWYETLNIA
jgi:hypothetical protein